MLGYRWLPLPVLPRFGPGLFNFLAEIPLNND